jgi:glycosyltransferase involved in cell wall biosynthesis
MRIFDIPLIAAAVPVLTWSGYLFTLTVLSARRASPPYSTARLRFDILIPAHNEEGGIEATIAGLRELDYPESLRRIVVVADHCTDETAARARAAGAHVLVHDDITKRGKGYALEFAFSQLLQEGEADAIVVIEANSDVSANFLRAFSARFERGAPVVQARCGMRNRDASWRTRLMRIAFATDHDVRSLGRERLGGSCGLRGSGMGFRSEILRNIPHDAFSVFENVEVGIALAKLGHRIWYAEEAHVAGDLGTAEASWASRHQRWEDGRWNLVRRHGLDLIRQAIRKGDRVLVDVAFDMIVPPLSYVALASLAGITSAGIAVMLGGASPYVLVPWTASAAMLAAYVARGVALSGTGSKGFVDLKASPFFEALNRALAVRGGVHSWQRVRSTCATEGCA